MMISAHLDDMGLVGDDDSGHAVTLMRDISNILKFGWPYLRRYAFRFFVGGVVLGIVFALMNAVILGGADVVLRRLKPAAPAVETAKTNEKPPNPLETSQSLQTLKGTVKQYESKLLELADPWLPRAGRKMDSNQILGVLLLFPLLMALRGYTGYLSSYCLGWVSERVVNDLQVDVLKKLQSLSVDFFNRSQTGDLTTRVHSDTATLQRALNLGLSDLVKEPATVVFTFGFLLWKDFTLTASLLTGLPIILVPILILGKKVRKAAHATVKAKVSQSSLLIEMLAGIRVVKAFGLEQYQIERFREYAKELVRQGVKTVQARELVNPIIETMTAFVFGVVLIFLFQSGRSSEDMLIFIGGLVAVYTPLKKIAGLHVLFQQTSAGVDRLAQMLSEQPTVQEPAQPSHCKPFTQSIRFDHIGFAYRDTPVLSDLTLEIRRGEKLGVAGESGSGKSTLVNLLFRFYDPTSGALLLDGVSLKDLSTQDLRKQMALVSQEVVLFDQTVAENIACGRLGASREEIVEAARAARAHDFISQLPKGYDTPIGERGVTLSGGQRQRLAIARAFIRNAPILVLDEATAALDAQSEAEVQQSIDALAEHRTVVCVAHRLATLASMDRIIVLSQGRLVESGTFQELVAKQGIFAGMARRQGMH